MSIGNTKDQGNKGNNFPYQLSNVQLLGEILSSVSPISGLATEATLLQVLTAINNGQEYEAFLVTDANDTAWLEVRIWNTVTNTFDPPVYYLAGSNTIGTPVAPITYINPNTLLATIASNTTGINLESTQLLVKANTDNLDVALSTVATEATQLSAVTELGLIKTNTNNLDTTLSSRATEATALLSLTELQNANTSLAGLSLEATQLLVKAVLDNIKLDTANLDVALSTVATEITLGTIKTVLDNIKLDTANLDTALSTIATEITLSAVKTVLDNIKLDTAKLDVNLSTIASETTLTTVKNNVTSKIDRIKGTANYNRALTYDANFNVTTITHTGTTALGAETIIETFTYDINSNVTNIAYS